MFEVVWMYFVAALNAVRKRVPQVQVTHEFVPQNFLMNFSKQHFQTTTLGPKTVFEVVWMYFVTALNAVRKRVPLVQLTHKFVPLNFFLNFSMEHFQTTTLGPKIVLGGLDVFRCRTKCGDKTVTSGAINAQVRAAKLFYEFFKATLRNHYFRSQNGV